MSILNDQTLYELNVTQTLTNNLAANLNTKGVPSTSDEGLDTLVPKVLQIESGAEKTPYEEWQEGFGANWDSVVANAPQAGNQPCLFIYNKVNEIKYSNVGFNAVTYNPETDTYTPIVANANNNLVFSQTDYFTNSYDNNQYVCVILKTLDIQWGSFNHGNGTSLVYANTKYCNTYNKDVYINPIRSTTQIAPLLRGVDGYSPSIMNIGSCLEHLTLQEYPENMSIDLTNTVYGYSVAGDTQIRLIKNIVDNKPITTTLTVTLPQNLTAAIISDRKLADWFYNDFFYNYYNGTTYGGVATGLVTKKTYKFKVNSNIQLTTALQLNLLPDCVYLEGTFTENQSNDANSAGIHRGFQSNQFQSLKNFPMWTVLGGAATGCLLPMTTQNVNNYVFGSFLFYSLNLESRYFCEFDENGIIEDPTKYFICNLPVEINTHANIYVRFTDLTFKNNYTAAQQDLIRAYLAHKKWNLSW